MFRNADEPGCTDTLDKYQLEYFEHYAIQGDYPDQGVWFRRLVVIGTQCQHRQDAPPLLTSGELIDQRISACVAFAHWMRRSGTMTQAEIASYLNDNGQTTVRGRPWTQGTLNRYLTGRAVAA